MQKQITMTLVIIRPGHLWSGLQPLLRTISQIEIIAESQDPSVLVKVGKEICPGLIIIDASIVDETNWTEITKIKSEWPQIKIVVLTENDLQWESAKGAGVDKILPKGFPAAKLVEFIQNILIQK